MTFLEKLDFLMKENDLNKKRLSDRAGIPYSTIDGFYKQGYANIKLSTFKKLCDYFGVTMDYLARDEIEKIEYYSPNKKDLYNPEEKELLEMYNQLNNSGREKILERGSELLELGYIEKGDEEKMA